MQTLALESTQRAAVHVRRERAAIVRVWGHVRAEWGRQHAW
jgi:hypothetical protein